MTLPRRRSPCSGKKRPTSPRSCSASPPRFRSTASSRRRRRRENQGADQRPICRTRYAHHLGLAALRRRALPQASRTRAASTRAPTTASTTTRPPLRQGGGRGIRRWDFLRLAQQEAWRRGSRLAQQVFEGVRRKCANARAGDGARRRRPGRARGVGALRDGKGRPRRELGDVEAARRASEIAIRLQADPAARAFLIERRATLG